MDLMPVPLGRGSGPDPTNGTRGKTAPRLKKRQGRTDAVLTVLGIALQSKQGNEHAPGRSKVFEIAVARRLAQGLPQLLEVQRQR
jgi:hypothetical protein